MSLELKDPIIFERLSHFFSKMFQSKEDKTHQKQIDSLFKRESPTKWDGFKDSVKSKEFVSTLKKDPRSDPKLILHAEKMHALHNGQEVGKVPGSRGKTYSIKKLSDGTLGCTCNDWRYVRSVTPGSNCKHINEYKRRK